jgi:hypothetical protein
MKIKIFYNNDPGERINHDFLSDKTWESYPFSSFHHVLNTLGIDYKWSNDKKDSVKILDIGSFAVEENLEKLEEFIQTYLNEFGKIILYTAQEPILKRDKLYLLNKYDNLFIMDIKYSENPFHERYIPFPFLFVRLMNNFLDVTELTPHIQLSNYDTKLHDFHNLKARWTPDKFATQYYLNDGPLGDNNLITYQRPENLNSLRLRIALYNFFDFKETPVSRKYMNHVYDFLTNHPTVGLQPDKNYWARYRYHPQYIYDETYYSLISENFLPEFTWLNNLEVTTDEISIEEIANYFYISEKTIYPIMQGHPLKVIGNPGNNYMLEKLGFKLFDEILNYDYDLICNPVERIKQAVKSCETFCRGQYQKYYKEIVDKILYNQKHLMNINSSLWENLKQKMLKNLRVYYES